MSDAAVARGVHSPLGVAAARRAFVAWVAAAPRGERRFLQVLIRSVDGRFEIRHQGDAGRPASELERATDPYAARAIAQTTATGAHRPLKTAPNLRRGWVLAELDRDGLCVAVDYLYPACIAHWHAGRSGSLRVTHWRETAARQSGIYSAVGLLADEAVSDTVSACCDDAVCLRQVAWRVDESAPPTPVPPNTAHGEPVPCPEACSLFVSLARKVLSLERQPRRKVAGLGTLSRPELAQIRTLVSAAADGALGSVRDGDFEEATNLRRVRYLAARLRREEE